MRYRHIIVALLVAFAAEGWLAARSASSADLKNWPKGPIRYIIQRDEERAFKQLRTNTDRALFIERFWRRRDPDWATLANEYRKLFWDRVAEANRLFLDSSTPGWKTDRGKVHILYGAPTDVESVIDLRVNDTSGAGVIRWIYQGRPGGRTDVDNVVIVPFERDLTGEYRLSLDPQLNSPFFNPYTYRPGEDPLEDFQDRFRTAPSRLALQAELGKLQEVPPEVEVFLERIETLESYRSEPLGSVITQLRHPERPDGKLVSITISLEDQAAERPARLFARFSPTDAPGDSRILDDLAFRLTADGGRRVAQARIHLDYGAYDVLLMAVDGIRSITGVERRRLEVRPPAETIHTTDVVFASHLEPVIYKAMITYDEPFHIGPFRAVPRTDNRFVPGEVVRLFYEVYQAELPLDVSYTVERKKAEGWTALGPPARAQQSVISQGWELPTTERWPLGDYRIVAEVLDAQGRQVRREIGFQLIEQNVPAVAQQDDSEKPADGS